MSDYIPPPYKELGSFVEIISNGLDEGVQYRGLTADGDHLLLMETTEKSLDWVICQLNQAGSTRSLSFGSKGRKLRTRLRCLLNRKEVCTFKLALLESGMWSIKISTLNNLSQKLRKRVKKLQKHVELVPVAAAPPSHQEVSDGGGFGQSLVNPGGTFMDGSNKLKVVKVENDGLVRCQLLAKGNGNRWLKHKDVARLIRTTGSVAPRAPVADADETKVTAGRITAGTVDVALPDMVSDQVDSFLPGIEWGLEMHQETAGRITGGTDCAFPDMVSDQVDSFLQEFP